MRDLLSSISVIMGVITITAMLVAIFLGDTEQAILLGVLALILKPDDK